MCWLYQQIYKLSNQKFMGSADNLRREHRRASHWRRLLRRRRRHRYKSSLDRDSIDRRCCRPYDEPNTIARTEGLMRNTIAGVFVAVAGLLAHSAPLLAHHGTASFDDKILTLKGTVTEWVWSNPHC